MSKNFVIETLKKIKTEQLSNKLLSTIGIIVDATNPNRRDVKKDYCMRIKLTDQTANNQELTVFIYAKNLTDFPVNLAIGDILLVRNYVFENSNGKLSCKKPFNSLQTEYRFFSGKSEETGYYPIDDNIGVDDENGVLLSNINNLRKFSRNYFKSNNISLFSKGGKNTSSDFDLILKVTGSQEQNNHSWKILMTDTKNTFTMLHSRNIKAGVYKVRSVANVSWNEKNCTLTGNDFTNFLEVADWMKSYNSKEWEKISVEKSDIVIQNQNIATKILYEKRGQPRQLITLKELIKRENHSEELKVKCQFMDVFTSFENALKKFDDVNLIEKEYQHENGKYIYNIHFAISDDSLTNEIYNVYLYTYDEKGTQFLPGLSTDGIFGKNILDYREKYNHIVNRLLEETDFQSAPIEIVLSPMFNGRETIYRIVDTQLIL